MCMRVSAEARTATDVIPQELSTLFWGHGFSVRLSNLALSKPQECSCLHLPGNGITITCPNKELFTWILVTELRSSCLCGQYFPTKTCPHPVNTSLLEYSLLFVYTVQCQFYTTAETLQPAKPKISACWHFIKKVNRPSIVEDCSLIRIVQLQPIASNSQNNSTILSLYRKD